MLSHLHEVKDHLAIVLNEMEWENLTPNQWKQLTSTEKVLQPFAHLTNLISSEKSTSIAMTIPVLKELYLHLNKVI